MRGAVLALALAASLAFGFSPIAPARASADDCRRTSNSNHDEILTGDCWFWPGTVIPDLENTVELITQDDGNLVLYEKFGPTAIWATHTTGHSYARPQTDGNLVVYAWNGTPLWPSATQGQHNYPAVQTDGNIVIHALRQAFVGDEHPSLTDAARPPGGPLAFPGRILRHGIGSPRPRPASRTAADAAT